MKKIKSIALVALVALLTSTISYASSNKFSYNEGGKTKVFTVSVYITSGKNSSHTIAGEYNSYPTGYGKIYFMYNGRRESKVVYGASNSSYWSAGSNLTYGNIYRASTTVTSKGLNKTVTDYYN